MRIRRLVVCPARHDRRLSCEVRFPAFQLIPCLRQRECRPRSRRVHQRRRLRVLHARLVVSAHSAPADLHRAAFRLVVQRVCPLHKLRLQDHRVRRHRDAAALRRGARKPCVDFPTVERIPVLRRRRHCRRHVVRHRDRLRVVLRRRLRRAAVCRLHIAAHRVRADCQVVRADLPLRVQVVVPAVYRRKVRLRQRRACRVVRPRAVRRRVPAYKRIARLRKLRHRLCRRVFRIVRVQRHIRVIRAVLRLRCTRARTRVVCDRICVRIPVRCQRIVPCRHDVLRLVACQRRKVRSERLRCPMVESVSRSRRRPEPHHCRADRRYRRLCRDRRRRRCAHRRRVIRHRHARIRAVRVDRDVVPVKREDRLDRHVRRRHRERRAREVRRRPFADLLRPLHKLVSVRRLARKPRDVRSVRYLRTRRPRRRQLRHRRAVDQRRRLTAFRSFDRQRVAVHRPPRVQRLRRRQLHFRAAFDLRSAAHRVCRIPAFQRVAFALHVRPSLAAAVRRTVRAVVRHRLRLVCRPRAEPVLRLERSALRVERHLLRVRCPLRVHLDRRRRRRRRACVARAQRVCGSGYAVLRAARRRVPPAVERVALARTCRQLEARVRDRPDRRAVPLVVLRVACRACRAAVRVVRHCHCLLIQSVVRRRVVHRHGLARAVLHSRCRCRACGRRPAGACPCSHIARRRQRSFRHNLERRRRRRVPVVRIPHRVRARPVHNSGSRTLRRAPVVVHECHFDLASPDCVQLERAALADSARVVHRVDLRRRQARSVFARRVAARVAPAQERPCVVPARHRRIRRIRKRFQPCVIRQRDVARHRRRHAVRVECQRKAVLRPARHHPYRSVFHARIEARARVVFRAAAPVVVQSVARVRALCDPLLKCISRLARRRRRQRHGFRDVVCRRVRRSRRPRYRCAFRHVRDLIVLQRPPRVQRLRRRQLHFRAAFDLRSAARRVCRIPAHKRVAQSRDRRPLLAAAVRRTVRAVVRHRLRLARRPRAEAARCRKRAALRLERHLLRVRCPLRVHLDRRRRRRRRTCIARAQRVCGPGNAVLRAARRRVPPAVERVAFAHTRRQLEARVRDRPDRVAVAPVVLRLACRTCRAAVRVVRHRHCLLIQPVVRRRRADRHGIARTVPHGRSRRRALLCRPAGARPRAAVRVRIRVLRIHLERRCRRRVAVVYRLLRRRRRPVQDAVSRLARRILEDRLDVARPHCVQRVRAALAGRVVVSVDFVCRNHVAHFIDHQRLVVGKRPALERPLQAVHRHFRLCRLRKRIGIYIIHRVHRVGHVRIRSHAVLCKRKLEFMRHPCRLQRHYRAVLGRQVLEVHRALRAVLTHRTRRHVRARDQVVAVRRRRPLRRRRRHAAHCPARERIARVRRRRYRHHRTVKNICRLRRIRRVPRELSALAEVIVQPVRVRIPVRRQLHRYPVQVRQVPEVHIVRPVHAKRRIAAHRCRRVRACAPLRAARHESLRHRPTLERSSRVCRRRYLHVFAVCPARRICLAAHCAAAVVVVCDLVYMRLPDRVVRRVRAQRHRRRVLVARQRVGIVVRVPTQVRVPASLRLLRRVQRERRVVDVARIRHARVAVERTVPRVRQRIRHVGHVLCRVLGIRQRHGLRVHAVICRIRCDRHVRR